MLRPLCLLLAKSAITRIQAVVVIVLIVIALSYLIAPYLFGTRDYISVVLAGISILGLSLLNVITPSLQAYEKFILSAASSTLYSFLRLIFLLLIILIEFPVSVASLVLVTAIAVWISLFVGLKLLNLKLTGPLPRSETYKSFLTFSGWLGLSRIFGGIASRLDIQLLLLLRGPYDTGIYSLASRGVWFYFMIVMSFNSAFAPYFASGKKILQLAPFLRKALITVLGFIALMLLTAIFAHLFFPLLFGAKSSDAVLPFQWLTIAFVPIVVHSIFSSLIVYVFKKTYIIGLISIIQLIVIMIGNFTLIPRLGVYGPIMTLGLSNTLTLLISSSVVFYYWRK